MLRPYRSRGLANLPSRLSHASRPSCWLVGAPLAVTTAARLPHVRGKKTKTTVSLADLPQGVIQSPDLPQDEVKDEPSYPTVVLQARRNMQKFDNCVLLTRVGGFYELYFEHAEEYGPLLNIKVATKKTNAGSVPMVCKHGHDTELIAYCHTFGLNVLTVPRLASHSSS
jgi:hypothetical protein